MAPVKLRFLDKRQKKSGRCYWYFRHPDIERTRLPGKPGDVEFHRTYQRLLDKVVVQRVVVAQLADERSIRTLSEAYRASDEWSMLSDDTQRSYAGQLDRLNRLAGDLPFAKMTKAGVLALRKTVKADVVEAATLKLAAREARDKALRDAGKTIPTRRKKPTLATGARTADLFKATLSAMYTWAIDSVLLPEHFANPAGTVKKLQAGKKGRAKGIKGRTPWTEDQISLALKSAPQPVRDGIVLGLYTGQRLEDCISALVRQCVGTTFQVTQSKTSTPLVVPITGPLVELVNRRRDANGLRLLVQANGRPYSKRLFSEHLRQHLDSLDL